MPGERIHKVRLSHGTSQQLRNSTFAAPELRRIQRRQDGCIVQLTSRDIRVLIQWAMDVANDTRDAY